MHLVVNFLFKNKKFDIKRYHNFPNWVVNFFDNFTTALICRNKLKNHKRNINSG